MEGNQWIIFLRKFVIIFLDTKFFLVGGRLEMVVSSVFILETFYSLKRYLECHQLTASKTNINWFD